MVPLKNRCGGDDGSLHCRDSGKCVKVRYPALWTMEVGQAPTPGVTSFILQAAEPQDDSEAPLRILWVSCPMLRPSSIPMFRQSPELTA